MTTLAFAIRRLPRLFVADAINVTRDPTLLLAMLLSLAPAIAGFLARDTIDTAIGSTFQINAFFALILPVLICLPAFLVGWVTGFLFLEDRDDGLQLALNITPLGERGFLIYRILVTALITFSLSLLGCILLMSERGIVTAMVISKLVALEAVAAALILPAIARNKVEGLALSKVTNILALASLLALLPLPWRYFGAFIPTYWVGELILNAQDFPAPSFMIATGAGMAIHLFFAWLLYRRLNPQG
ncbi:MAG: hypothetical protein AAFR90_14375 [Pseudomonadota bacterium]